MFRGPEFAVCHDCGRRVPLSNGICILCGTPFDRTLNPDVAPKKKRTTQRYFFVLATPEPKPLECVEADE
jgi:predicted amidophosphoribosyltransferase